MIMNEQYLNDKEKEIVKLLIEYFERVELGDFSVYVEYGTPCCIEFSNDLFRFAMYYKPEDDVEAQIQIPTIFLDSSIRHRGIFAGLMKVLIKYCAKNELPILFLQVVSELFAEKLVKEYNGKIVHEDLLEGYFIFVLPEENIGDIQ